MLMVLNWDGKTVTGIINPGTDNMKIGNAHAGPHWVESPHRGRRQKQAGRSDSLRHRWHAQGLGTADPIRDRHLAEPER